MGAFDSATELAERLGLSRPGPDPGDDDLVDVPDDASELLGDGRDDDALPEDPKPARKKGRLRMPEGTVKATAAEKRQVKDALGLLIKVPAGIWEMKDPHCGGALKDQADDIIKSALPMICRHPGALRFFTSANAPWLDILGLMMAFAPVASTVYGHHVKHTIGEEGGPDVDLSAYAAPTF